MQLKAKREFYFAGKKLTVGESLPNPTKDEAQTLLLLGYAEREDEQTLLNDMVDEQMYITQAVEAPKRVRGPDKKKRSYKRRDMVAE